MNDALALAKILTCNAELLGDQCLSKVLRVTRFTICLKNDILLAQPATHPPETAPLILPPAVVSFLSRACALPPAFIIAFWDGMRHAIWREEGDSLYSMEEQFFKHGHDIGFGASLPLSRLIRNVIRPRPQHPRAPFTHLITSART
jgi:hypothetical protein